MKKILLLLLILSPAMLVAATLHYYSEGKRIELSEDFSSYTFIKNAGVKATFEIPSSVKIRQSKEGIFILEAVDAASREKLQKNGILFPAYRSETGQIRNLTGQIYVKLAGAPDESSAKKWCKDNNLQFIKLYKYAPGWIVASTGSQNPIKLSAKFVEEKLAVAAEPSFFIKLQKRAYIPDDPFFPKQWHLHNDGTDTSLTGPDHAHVAEAWELLKAFTGEIGGKGIKLAIADDGFDLDHEDFKGKFLPGYDFCDNDETPKYDDWNYDMHGTCCAGVAAAATDNDKGVAGACPNCKIIPIRLDFYEDLDVMGLNAFEFAAENGADIISNSWGPADNYEPQDMTAPLKELVANITSTGGRHGRGIIITFAAGNGDEPIETDGFASNPNVFAIGASRADATRCSYSDYGAPLDFMAPSSDYDDDTYEQVDGIWTVDNTGEDGYNDKDIYYGDPNGNYTNDFAGTSSACPLAAGIIGLVLQANPCLTRDEVYTLLAETSDKIGDVDYENGFNSYYGHGRINACEAVKKALETAGRDVSQATCGGEIKILENGENTVTCDMGDSGDTGDSGDSGDSGDTESDHDTEPGPDSDITPDSDEIPESDSDETASDEDTAPEPDTDTTKPEKKSSGCALSII